MSVKPGKLLSGEDLLQAHIGNDRSLLKIGEKQFEPTNSWLEKKQIQAALEESKQRLEEERVEKFGALAQAEWLNNRKLAEVTRKVGKFFRTMGFEKDGKLFIYPEEALYLMETNCLQLNYDGVPLSIQQAYSLLLSSPGCSLKEYRTYSHLSKQGYRLLRHTKTGIPTRYERRIRLDQHVPQKRVFPETNEVTLEPISGDVAGSSGTSVKEGSHPVERTEISDSRAKSEKDSAEVNEPMKDFAKSIADMGKFLIKNEKDGGSEGLVLESLRKKILDMLEDHFQGQISPEAMEAVSLSASKAIMMHVEDNDSEKTCATPSESVSSPSSSVSNLDSSARSGGKPPDEEDSSKSVFAETVRESEVEVTEKTSVSASSVEPKTSSVEDGSSKDPSENQHPEPFHKKDTQSDQDCSARSEGKQPNEEDSAMSVSVRESEAVVAEVAKKMEVHDKTDVCVNPQEGETCSIEGGSGKEQSENQLPVLLGKKDTQSDQDSSAVSEDKPPDEEDSAMSVCAESVRESEAEVTEKQEDHDKPDVSANPLEAKDSSIEDGSSKVQLPEPLSKNDTQSKESGENISNGNEERSDQETDSEEELELDEYPVEGSCSFKSSGSDFSEEECHTDLSECQVMGSQTERQEDTQVDDDVMEIEDPNTWKNVKVEKSSDKDSDSQKRPFPDSNGWRNFKESQSNISPGEKTQRDDDVEVDIVAVRNARDIEVELIDISDDSCVKPMQEPVEEKPSEEIEIVDLDESDSSSSSSSGNSDIKPEKLEQPQFTSSFKLENKRKEPPSKRPQLQSAFERARDQRRKFIMDSFPNMISQVVCKVEVPQRHLLPPNVSPVRTTYFVNRRGLYNESRQSCINPRRPFRFNNYHNNHPRPYHPHVRQPFKSPMNVLPWRPPAQINPAAMQAFQMITSIVLPMFGINNVGPTFMGQPQWNQAPPQWQTPSRNWQNQQQWRPPQHWNNRSNRPWHRNSDRDQHDVLERPKRPALLPNPGLSPAGLMWHEERPGRMPRRPKRPFVVEESARDLLTDIEEEARWKKIKRMEEEDSDSGSEVTITPVNRTPKTSNLQPLLRLENCKSSCDIMASIDVIKRADPRSLNASPENRILKISYDLFHPNIPFKKSSPPTPNFRLCIMSVEERMPSPGEISLLLDSIHDGVPVMFAVVSPDVTSYYQYSTVDLPKQTFSS